MVSLYEETIKLLNNGADISQVASKTNLQYDWVNKLKRGDIKDPSVNKVQAVYEYLTGRPLLSKDKS